MPVRDQGSLFNRYCLIPRVLIFLTRGDQLLLLKGSPNKPLWPNLYNGIGGHIEPGEDVLSAARRELYEETGFWINNLHLCGVITIDTGQPVGIGLYILRGEYPLSQGNDALLSSSPEGTLEWVNHNEYLKLPLVEDLYELLPRVLEQKASDPPFSAHYWYREDGHLNIKFYGE